MKSWPQHLRNDPQVFLLFITTSSMKMKDVIGKEFES